MKILLTTDFSEASTRAFQPTADLASKCGAKIVLLHVVEDGSTVAQGAPFAPAVTSPDISRLVEDAEKELAAVTDELPSELLDKTEVVTAADPVSGIHKYASEHDVDMIAMSTHGRTGLRRLVLGSVAEAVIRHSHKPVLCFPRPE